MTDAEKAALMPQSASKSGMRLTSSTRAKKRKRGSQSASKSGMRLTLSDYGGGNIVQSQSASKSGMRLTETSACAPTPKVSIRVEKRHEVDPTPLQPSGPAEKYRPHSTRRGLPGRYS